MTNTYVEGKTCIRYTSKQIPDFVSRIFLTKIVNFAVGHVSANSYTYNITRLISFFKTISFIVSLFFFHAD